MVKGHPSSRPFTGGRDARPLGMVVFTRSFEGAFGGRLQPFQVLQPETKHRLQGVADKRECDPYGKY